MRKTYDGKVEAVRGLDLDIQAGECFGLLGPNGAGKTTLISIICGIVTPSEGVVLVEGHDIIDEYRAARAKIAEELHCCEPGYETGGWL